MAREGDGLSAYVDRRSALSLGWRQQTGRNWQQFEMFALAPDPTAVVTLGVLLFYRAPVVLFVIPVLWLLISFTTLIVM